MAIFHICAISLQSVCQSVSFSLFWCQRIENLKNICFTEKQRDMPSCNQKPVNQYLAISWRLAKLQPVTSTFKHATVSKATSRLVGNYHLYPNMAIKWLPHSSAITSQLQLVAMQSQCLSNHVRVFNPLLHRLFLNHDISFYFKTTLIKFNKNSF